MESVCSVWDSSGSEFDPVAGSYKQCNEHLDPIKCGENLD